MYWDIGLRSVSLFFALWSTVLHVRVVVAVYAGNKGTFASTQLALMWAIFYLLNQLGG